MKTKMEILMLVLALAVGVLVGTAQGGEVYGDPGWSYIYEGDQANTTNLDGTWDHDNGSDQLDTSDWEIGGGGETEFAIGFESFRQ